MWHRKNTWSNIERKFYENCFYLFLFCIGETTANDWDINFIIQRRQHRHQWHRNLYSETLQLRSLYTYRPRILHDGRIWENSNYQDLPYGLHHKRWSACILSTRCGSCMHIQHIFLCKKKIKNSKVETTTTKKNYTEN